ncbi:Tkp3 protein [Vanderwaltozyma polyspora DSM 70294]|uniref:Tkp3 protein n=1 Tax=Vanderwaltozyma polyspora (strain ATCC 22028 / DSM 70294 / BCRC 21397 / CBS 2163 / NBRC 10782 / NRRL Y-8283 / UCD 57-17) TaxID=436907 RepID=A7TQ57_VANPO|nr:Tkp3 protein [Vanderwaltozyma polyspora DSM 70294]EDO15586.1 Tkp3 protein [Vanderwaltozyma polyspora DSM 70294]
MTDTASANNIKGRLNNLEGQVQKMQGQVQEMKGQMHDILQEMSKMSSSLEQLIDMLKTQGHHEEIHAKTLEQASIHSSNLQRNEDTIVNNKTRLERLEVSMEKRLIQIEERIMTGTPTTTTGNNLESKLPPSNEILAQVRKYFPSLVIYENHSLLKSCIKAYSDVSLVVTREVILKDDDLEDPVRTLMAIQGLLVGKRIRFQDWGKFLYSCCQDIGRFYLTNEQGINVDWTTAIFKLFEYFDFNAKTQKGLSEVSNFNPEMGEEARDYFVKLIRKGKAVRGASALAIVVTKIHDILMYENSLIPRPKITDIHNFVELLSYVKDNVPSGIILDGEYGNTASSPLFAIQGSESSSNPGSNSGFATAAYFCTKCQRISYPSTIKPYMEEELYSECDCDRSSSRLRGSKKSNVADLKDDILKMEEHHIAINSEFFDDSELDSETEDPYYDRPYTFENLDAIDFVLGPSVVRVTSLNASHPKK